jgi:hypothetical protein
VVAHSERMPLADLPRLGPALAEIERQCRAGPDDRRARWDAWWEQASSEPALQAAMTQRRAVFETTYPTEEFSPPADWHVTALRAAGFAEAASSGAQVRPRSSPQSDSSSFLRRARRHTPGVRGARQGGSSRGSASRVQWTCVSNGSR